MMDMKKTILVADDDETMDFSSPPSEKRDIIILTAEYGCTAVETFSRTGSDCDLIMPASKHHGQTLALTMEMCQKNEKGFVPVSLS